MVGFPAAGADGRMDADGGGPADLYQRLLATGIGYAGLDGAWWLPAAAPLVLPAAVATQLEAIGPALFQLCDVVLDLYRQGREAMLLELLHWRTPAPVRLAAAPGDVHAFRPDFQLLPDGAEGYRLVLTELEVCPSAHGFAHAMQHAYGLPEDLVAAAARFLGGRRLWMVGTHLWSEFLWEQLAFCRALNQAGGDGRVLFNRSLAEMDAEVRAGRRWRPPLFGVPRRPPAWQDDIRTRLEARGWASWAWPGQRDWPDRLADGVVFRFGYVDGFTAAGLAQMRAWQAGGATFLNPPHFVLDSKVLLAAMGLPAVRRRLAEADAGALAILDDCIPETVLVRAATLPRLRAERAEWVVKIAGFDGGEAGWGGRSLEVGPDQTPAEWAATLTAAETRPWPVIAQRLAPSAQMDIDYVDRDGQKQRLPNGRTRLRTFFWRDAAGAVAAGSHVTVAGRGLRVAESTDAVQAPVLFAAPKSATV